MNTNPARSVGHDKPKKLVTIIVNGREFQVEKDEITYAEVVALAYPDGIGAGDTIATVTYRRGQGNKPEGTLVPGQATKVKDGMIFNVHVTVRS